jgi:hypothetical protein
VPTCVTLVGANAFQVGASVQEYSVGTGGIVGLTNPSNPASAQSARQALQNSILGLEKIQSNHYLANYAKALEHSIDTGSALRGRLKSK